VSVRPLPVSVKCPSISISLRYLLMLSSKMSVSIRDIN
jgi:hypothetical protein